MFKMCLEVVVKNSFMLLKTEKHAQQPENRKWFFVLKNIKHGGL